MTDDEHKALCVMLMASHGTTNLAELRRNLGLADNCLVEPWEAMKMRLGLHNEYYDRDHHMIILSRVYTGDL